MKKYLLFQYGYHEARGGLFDLLESYETIEQAEQAVTEEYWHVIDRDTWECVAGNNKPNNQASEPPTKKL